MSTSYTQLSSTEVLVSDLVYSFESPRQAEAFVLCLSSGSLGGCLAVCHGLTRQRPATDHEMGNPEPEEDDGPSPM